MKAILAGLVLCALPVSPAAWAASSQDSAAPQSQDSAPQGSLDVSASRSGRDYRIFLSIPPGEPPARGFPVVYLLDASWYFEMARATAELLRYTGEMPPAVIVGIGYSDPIEAIRLRWHDFTRPNRSPLPVRLAEMGIEPGGAEDFTHFLDHDVSSILAERTSIDQSCRLLIGHSLGGVYALDVLINDSDSYQSYAIGDAAVWWDDHSILEGAEQLLERAARGELDRRLFLAHSTDPGPQGEIPDFILAFARFAERLAEQGGERLDMAIKPYRLDGHNSMVAGFISTALHTGLDCARDDRQEPDG